MKLGCILRSFKEYSSPVQGTSEFSTQWYIFLHIRNIINIAIMNKNILSCAKLVIDNT
jgi:hypothetical protein